MFPLTVSVIDYYGSTNYNLDITDKDFNTGPYTVIIYAGKNYVTFSISITDDNIREEPEIFHLIIDESTLPNGVTSRNIAAVTIMDNDSK